jgi:hypothetical protein
MSALTSHSSPYLSAANPLLLAGNRPAGWVLISVPYRVLSYHARYFSILPYVFFENHS